MHNGRGRGGGGRGGAYHPRGGGGGGGHCYRCGQPGHIQAHCSRNAGGRGGAIRPGGGGWPCYKCGQPGHRQPDCPQNGLDRDGHSLAGDQHGRGDSTEFPSSLDLVPAQNTVTESHEGLPPISWRFHTMFKTREEMEEAFYAYYVERGAVPGLKVPGALQRFQPECFSPKDGKIGQEWQIKIHPTLLQNDDHREAVDWFTHMTFDQAEEKRKETLAEFKEKFALIPENGKGSAEWWTLHNNIRAYEVPVSAPVLSSPRMDHDQAKPPNVDVRRSIAQLRDWERVVNGSNDANESTQRLHKRAILAMQRAGILRGEDGSWKPSAWGPELLRHYQNRTDTDNERLDQEVLDENSGKTFPAEGVVVPQELTTFHGFQIQHRRPNRIGIGYKGWDDVFEQQRDGKRVTSADVPQGPWCGQRDPPMQFVNAEDGSKSHLFEYRVNANNPIYEGRKANTAIKDLHLIMCENEKRKESAYERPREAKVNEARGRPIPAHIYNPGW
ncbi:hypothetical protein N0V82_007067 [Gnomoniopsis sp. IMI 355080]|nr:hypothetical protein N0V82_007067 [Gnomoniopsis sp. IMI 355080]